MGPFTGPGCQFVAVQRDRDGHAVALISPDRPKCFNGKANPAICGVSVDNFNRAIFVAIGTQKAVGQADIAIGRIGKRRCPQRRRAFLIRAEHHRNFLTLAPGKSFDGSVTTQSSPVSG